MTQLGHNPSYVWSNILRARFIVHGGARWSVGSGYLMGECIDGGIAGA